jgi:AcrR family transcriptional regulator
MKPPVKGPVGSRAERALATRHRMLTSAHALFVQQGYATTTVEQIAADAGVAVQTVYYTFRTKGLLLRELVEVTAAGEERAAPVMDRAWAGEMLSATSAQRVLALAVEHGTAIYERVAALWPTVAAGAAADPDMAAYWQAVGAGRREGQRRMVGRLVELDALRPGLDADRATDLVVMLLGHDVYRSLVVDAGWPLVAFRAWLFTTVVQQLFSPVELEPRAIEDLSYARVLGGSERT